MPVFSDGVIISFAPSALEELRCYLKKEGFALESGGILLGTRSKSGLEFSVEHFTLPDKTDERRMFSFLRRRQPANKIISTAWKETSGKVNYLGEWHTHNEITPVPSEADRGLMNNIVDDQSCLFERAFMIIIGSGGRAFVGEVDTRVGCAFKDSEYVDVWND